ncbi:MAG TPA: hypothetical protein VFV68_05820 [Agriterribacter sp.]|nr:hypothetical protein [Agriterribacter sp.]
MDEMFDLPVHYNNKALLFPSRLQSWGYSHRILVTVGNYVLIFEPDEERKYRALGNAEQTAEIPDSLLIEAIASTIETIFTEQ